MRIVRRVQIISVLAAMQLAGALALPAIAAVSPEEIDQSVAAAKAWLVNNQHDGNWELAASQAKGESPSDPKGGQWTGLTALAAYALLCTGDRPEEPHVAAAIEFLRNHPTQGTYALGVRCMLWGAIHLDGKTRPVAEKDKNLLLASMRTAGAAKGLYSYLPPINRNDAAFDHSASQFAPLGLWSLADQGFEIPDLFWKTTDQAWRAHQRDDGSWTYGLEGMSEITKPTASMTAAGLATLLITQQSLATNSNEASAPADPKLAKGMAWLANNFDAVFDQKKQFLNEQYFTYALFGISRVGLISGYRRFGKVDWFSTGADYLIHHQSPDGRFAGDMDPSATTSLGLLFLCYGRAPVVINKLQYSITSQGAAKPANWAQRPLDAANFARWMTKTIEKKLAWQIVDLSVTPAELHEGAILYISGDQPLEFSADEQKTLRRFVEDGGVIVGNANGNSRGFSTSFTKLGSALFPSYEFRILPVEHSIFRDQQFRGETWKPQPKVMGLGNGVREFMLLPQVDLSRAFQARATAMGGAGGAVSFELADDIVLYAVDGDLHDRGKTYLVEENPAAPVERTIDLARLQYSGAWDPEPGGWRRLAAILHNQSKVKLNVKPVRIADLAGSTCKIAHLTGTTAVHFSDDERKALHAFIDRGGLLLIDSAGGSTEFAVSIEGELNQILGQNAASSLAALKPDHPLYHQAGAEINSVDYRRAARAATVGNIRVPRLSAIEINGHIGVLYSREDLSAGLVGESIAGVNGYQPASAVSLVTAAVLWAGK